MPARKYFDGMHLGPKNILLVKYLSHGKGLFECPICHTQEWKTLINDVVGGKAIKCKNCRKKEQSEFFSQMNTQNYNDISNKKFGYLIAIEPTKKRQNTYVVWKCYCTKCNSYSEHCYHDLIKGSTTSCGCGVKSRGEEKIASLLNNLHFLYEQQKKFSDCIGVSGIVLRFDFYLPAYNCCIEFQGEQHYKAVKYFGGEKHFQKQQSNDCIKRQYCIDNNIKLIEIPYFDYDNMDIDYLKEKICD